MLLLIIGKIISSNSVFINLFRSNNFKGNTILSEYIVTPDLDGVYSVGNLKYDFKFSDEIQKQIYLGV